MTSVDIAHFPLGGRYFPINRPLREPLLIILKINSPFFNFNLL
jgi:hypothetical protein